MNNGKVRIYELSKELNLDNKDILAVCDQLDIAVKSHSSTISEADAKRIRAAAESQPSRSVSVHTRPTSGVAEADVHSDRSGKGRPTKQQILEIRHNAPSADSAPKLGTVAPVAPRPIQPPNLSNSPMRLVRPTPPTTPTPTPTAPPTAGPEPVTTTPEVIPPLQPPTPSVEPPAVVKKAVEVPESAPVKARDPRTRRPPAPPKVELIGPPKRDTEPEPVVAPVSSVSPPVPAKPKQVAKPSAPEKPMAAESSRSSGGEMPTAASPARPKPRREGQVAPAPAAKGKATPKPQEIVELRRPKAPPTLQPPPKPLEAQAVGKEGIAELESVRETPDLELKRPVAPRPPKRKKREDEEEEIQEKASKLVAKTKRRSHNVFDDDESEELELANRLAAAASAQISLSLARPPKPKGRPSQPQPVAAPTTRNRKPPVQRDSSGGGGGSSSRQRNQPPAKPERPEKLTLMTSLTVQELANELAVPETEIVKLLFYQGIAATITQTLDLETAKMVAESLGVTVETSKPASEARKVTEMLDVGDLDHLHRRPPVVTIMGHVDHGKTTLLDSIRKSKVAQGEAGGITQHIGAYHVDVEHNGQVQQVVFLDTPGHEAFTAMRARGTRVTDIAILVVAADDGVQPQTIEALRHAEAAEVPIIVAINKIDKEGAQPDRVKQELTEYGLLPEEWGGETIVVPVSAMTGENLDTLLEMILLVAEVEDLGANPDRPAKGTVIEAHLDKAKGPVATLLIQNGTLRVGDILLAGSAFGKVRAMVDDLGMRVQDASPSFAVEVLGLSDVPAAGDEFEVFLDEKEARATAETRFAEQRQTRLQQAMSSRRVSLSSLSARAQEGQLKELNLVLKADVQGSVEAILGALEQLPQNEVQVRVLFAAPGEITETDVDLAAASSAVIVGFNTTLATGARQAAFQAGVDVRDYDIIYKLLEDIQGAMEGLLDPEMVEEPLGQAEVRAVFPVGRGFVAGSYVQSGKLLRNCNVRVRRGNQIVHEGVLNSLKRMKEDAREVNAGYECGIGVDRFSDWAEGDIVEAFRMASKRRTLSGT